MGVDHFMYIHF